MTAYCTRADIEALWPPGDLIASVDDDGDGVLSPLEESHIERAIERAGWFLEARLCLRYRPADLAANPWCREACAVLAAWWLACRRGGPPPALQSLYDACRMQLDQIVAGRARLPGVPDAPGNLPAAQRFTLHWEQRSAVVRRDLWCV